MISENDRLEKKLFAELSKRGGPYFEYNYYNNYAGFW